MVECRQEGVGVWGQIDPCSSGFQLENIADERGVLMGKPVMLLSRPSAGLDVVDAGYILVPFRFPGLVQVSMQQGKKPSRRTIFMNFAYCTIMVWTIPRKLS